MKSTFVLISRYICAIVAVTLSVQPFAESAWPLQKIRDRFLSHQKCQDLLMLPMSTIMFAKREDFDLMCSASPGHPNTYFNNCADEFVVECKRRNCDMVTMKKWIDAFPKAGDSYVCQDAGYDYLNATQVNGGQACMQKIEPSLFEDILGLYSGTWFGVTMNCSTMDEDMMDVYDDMNQCDSKSLRDITAHYLNHVIDLSPCAGQFHIGGATARSIANTGIIVLSLVITFAAHN